ncbi:MAG: PEGA domain-containing protein, partial [Candidatus Delongbacteria bacterium]|nr:PEGA domain-containing protein [Candidatus Delongbacteria bacterium]
VLLSAKIVTINGEYDYRFSDKEAFADAKDKCLELAKKDAVSKFATSISSVSIVQNSMMEKDQLIAISLGTMRNIVIDEDSKIEDRSGSHIFYKITGEIDEEQVLAKLEAKLREIKEITLLEGEVYELIFKMNTDKVYISRDNGAPIISSSSNAIFRIPSGNHKFSFIKDGFKEQSTEINLTSDKSVDITLEAGQNKKKLKLPSIVRLNSNPNGAEIYLNEQKIGLTPLQYNLLPGFYNLKIMKDLYYTKLTDFTVNEGETFELPVIDLKPRFGSLAITSQPERCKIYVDGIFEGYSPLKKEMFLSGSHTVRAESELYHDEIQDFHIADGENKNISLNLKQAFGVLYINSKPEGAKVFIDDKEVGVTPYNNSRISSKIYKIRLEKRFYSDVTKSTEVKDAQKTNVDFVMDMNVGILNINADKSDIFVNGKSSGSGNIKLNLQGGNYTITAKKQFHKDAQQTVYLSVGEEKVINLTPEPILGSLSIISEPFDSNGAKIFIDNTPTSYSTPSVFPYIIGNHTLKLTHPKFLDKEEFFNLNEGETKEISLRMLTYEGSQKAKKDFWKTQKWIALGSSVAFAGSGLLCSSTADNYYDDYMKTTSTNEAVDLYDKSTNFDLYKDISYGVSISSLGYFFYAWYMESRY